MIQHMSHNFSVLPGTYALVRFAPETPLPEWAFASPGFTSVTRTADELSIVCPDDAVPEGVRNEGGWRAVKLHGPFAFDQVGVLSSFTVPLAQAGVAIFALSTFDTDYVLVKASQLGQAIEALRAAGHSYQAADFHTEA